MPTLNLQVGADASDGLTYYTPPGNNPGTPAAFFLTVGVVGDTETGDGTSWIFFAHFVGVSGLSGATIDSALFSVWGAVADQGTPETLISAEDEASPAAPTTKEEHDGATRTAAGVPWDDCNLNIGAFVSSPEIKTVIQELADDYDPDEIVILWDDDLKTDSSNNARPEVHNNDPAEAAKLDIDYETVGVEERSVAGDQPAATGTLTRKEQAERATAGVQPAPSGTVAQSAGSTFSRSVAGNQPAPSGALARTAGVFARTAAGAQPAPSGALSRTEQALRAVAGDQPASSGALTRKEQALRAVTGAQPASTGTLAQSAGSAFSRSLAGAQPAPTSTLTRTEQALRALAGAQAAPSGALTRVHRRLRSIAGNQPAALGTIAAVLLVTRRTITGVQPAPSGTLTKVGAFARSLAGDQPNPTGTLARAAGTFNRSLAGSQPAAVGVLVRSKHWSRSIAGDQAFATGIVTLRTLVLTAVPGAHAQLAPFNPSVEAIIANLIENPSLEVGLGGWTSPISGTFTRDTSMARYGEACAKLASTGGGVYTVLIRGIDGNRIAVTSGTLHGFRISLRTDKDSSWRWLITWYNAAEAQIGSAYEDAHIYDGGPWAEVTISATSPATAVTALLACLDLPSGAAGSFWDENPGEALYMDGASFYEDVDGSFPYADGDQEGYYWVGVPHESASAKAPALVLPRGRATAIRTVEGEARSGRPLTPGKAV